jgi:hypothetical protein
MVEASMVGAEIVEEKARDVAVLGAEIVEEEEVVVATVTVGTSVGS